MGSMQIFQDIQYIYGFFSKDIKSDIIETSCKNIAKILMSLHDDKIVKKKKTGQ
jgi:hypothetical protein